MAAGLRLAGLPRCWRYRPAGADRPPSSSCRALAGLRQLALTFSDIGAVLDHAARLLQRQTVVLRSGAVFNEGVRPLIVLQGVVSTTCAALPPAAG